MYLVPLTQLESVELLVHCLKAAGGEADCSLCPAYKVCMKQCLTIAGAIGTMLEQGTLPLLGEKEPEPSPPEDETDPPSPSPSGAQTEKGGLRIVK